MTGPEHYKTAENLIAGGVKKVTPWGDTDWVAPSPEAVARAQVHATLALAAATALGGPTEDMPWKDWSAWNTVAGAS